ncbi:hypothetical protein TNCV_2016041 [Trichonephila clavipes]|nr:hypothetical protein TNCV_2016041 [Trichonephila clavipes]
MQRCYLVYISWKLSKTCSFRMEFKSLLTFRCMSGISSNLFPFEASLSHGNWKKSGGLRSGEYGRCPLYTPLFGSPLIHRFDNILRSPDSGRQVIWLKTPRFSHS